MEFTGKGVGNESIDHINQNKLDNRKVNLRIVSQSIQNQNRKKVARHANARELPEGIGERIRWSLRTAQSEAARLKGRTSLEIF